MGEEPQRLFDRLCGCTLKVTLPTKPCTAKPLDDAMRGNVVRPLVWTASWSDLVHSPSSTLIAINLVYSAVQVEAQPNTDDCRESGDDWSHYSSPRRQHIGSDVQVMPKRSSPKRYFCPHKHCRFLKGFDRPCRLQTHLLRSHKGQIEQCSCGQAFTTGCAIENHRRQCHQGDPRIGRSRSTVATESSLSAQGFAGSTQLSEYEQARVARIEANRAHMEELGLLDALSSSPMRDGQNPVRMQDPQADCESTTSYCESATDDCESVTDDNVGQFQLQAGRNPTALCLQVTSDTMNSDGVTEIETSRRDLLIHREDKPWIHRNIPEIKIAQEQVWSAMRGRYQAEIASEPRSHYLTRSEVYNNTQWSEGLLEWWRLVSTHVSHHEMDMLCKLAHDCFPGECPPSVYILRQVERTTLRTRSVKSRKVTATTANGITQFEVVHPLDCIKLVLKDANLAPTLLFEPGVGHILQHPRDGLLWKTLYTCMRQQGADSDVRPLFFSIYHDDYLARTFGQRQSGGFYMVLENLPLPSLSSHDHMFVLSNVGPEVDRKIVYNYLLSLVHDIEGKCLTLETAQSDGSARKERFRPFLFAIKGDRVALSRMLDHYGHQGTKFCPMCLHTARSDWSQDGISDGRLRTWLKTTGDMLQILADVGRGRASSHQAKHRERQIGYHVLENRQLPPIFCLKYFNPVTQAPSCEMHNGPLGIVKDFLTVWVSEGGHPFKDELNNAIKREYCPSFPGLRPIHNGIYCTAADGRGISLRKLSAQQIVAFCRRAPAFLYKYIPREEFALFMDYLSLYFWTSQRRVPLSKLPELHKRAAQFIQAFKRVYHGRCSTAKWNLHTLIHKVDLMVLLGPLYLQSGEAGETLHADNRSDAVMTNPGSQMTVESQVLRKQILRQQWRTSCTDQGLGSGEVLRKEPIFVGLIKKESNSNEVRRMVEAIRCHFRVGRSVGDIDELAHYKFLVLPDTTHRLKAGHFVAVNGMRDGELAEVWYGLALEFVTVQLHGHPVAIGLAKLRWFEHYSRASRAHCGLPALPCESRCARMVLLPPNHTDYIPVESIVRRVDMIKEMKKREEQPINSYMYNPWATFKVFENLSFTSGTEMSIAPFRNGDTDEIFIRCSRWQ